MKVEMIFNKDKIVNDGYTLENIYENLKEAFTKRGLRCSSDNEILIFEGVGSVNDFANMISLLVKLLQIDWFIQYATSCILYERENGTSEDVLSQASKIRRMLA